MCEAQNAANPNGFASILTKSQRESHISKSDSGLNALAKLARVEPYTVSLNAFIYCTLRSFLQGVSLTAKSRFVH